MKAMTSMVTFSSYQHPMFLDSLSYSMQPFTMTHPGRREREREKSKKLGRQSKWPGPYKGTQSQPADSNGKKEREWVCLGGKEGAM